MAGMDAVPRRGFWLACAALCLALGCALARRGLPPDDGLDLLLRGAQASTGRTLPEAAGWPGPVSVGFAQDMSLHHEQALVMAALAQERGSPAVRALAQGIHDAQLKELGVLQGWLMLWDAPAAADSGAMDWMKAAYWQAKRRDEGFELFINACATGGTMPGLATAAQLDELARLQGTAFDRRFLALMERHHRGAVVMARFAREHGEHAAVRGLAAAMGGEQRREWMQMAGLLAALQDEAAPPPAGVRTPRPASRTPPR